MILPRRSFLAGLGSLLAAPAIVRAESLMPVKAIEVIKPETGRLFRIVQTVTTLSQHWSEITVQEVLESAGSCGWSEPRARLTFSSSKGFQPFEVGDLIRLDF